MLSKSLRATLYILFLAVLACIELTVAAPVVTLSVLTTRLGTAGPWVQVAATTVLSLVMSVVLHVPWYQVYAVLLIVPAVMLWRSRAVQYRSLPLPLVFLVSVLTSALLLVLAQQELSLGLVLHTLFFGVSGYASMHFLRSRQQRRRLVEWLWVQL